MTFDNFRKVQKCYNSLSKGKYNKKQVDATYKLLPEDFKVKPASKNEKVAAIKMWFEKVFLEAIEKILPNGNTGQTSTEKSE